METTAIVKQVIGFQKTLFENSFTVIVSAQDQTEKLVNSYIDQLPWVTPEGKNSMMETVEICKKARDDFKKTVEDGYAKFEELMVSQVKEVPVPTKKAA